MNSEPSAVRRVAIVGGGPRGLASLESLLAAVAKCGPSWSLKLTLFERGEHPGAGPNYEPTLFEGCWLNLPERLLDIPARPDITLHGIVLPAFPDYLTWVSGCESKIDRYPARALLGRYLTKRFDSLVQPLQQSGLLSLIRNEVVAVRPCDIGKGYAVEYEAGVLAPAEEVLLTIGHQDTRDDASLMRWREHVDSHPHLLLVDRPYDDDDWLRDERVGNTSVVALRGMGLSMIDAVSLLTEGRGGRFQVINEHDQSMRYESCGDEPARLVPFSLDGLPLAAKPLNRELDESFKPADGELRQFRQRCQSLVSTADDIDDVRTRLCQAVACVQAQVYQRVVVAHEAHRDSRQQWQSLAMQWLQNDQLEHERLTDLSVSTVQIMQAWLAMACGQCMPTFDYCLGQVWRHLQRTLFHELSCSGLPDDAMQWIAGLHERMKRFSYGPPVGSLQRLVALHEAGRLTFVVADDPDIEFSHAGWLLKHQGDRVEAAVMIDTVQASPAVDQVSAPLVRQLLDDGLLQPVGDGLGAKVDAEGQVLMETAIRHPSGLSMLGRLAKGRVIGVDSIVESFGERPQRWAEGVVKRLDATEP